MKMMVIIMKIIIINHHFYIFVSYINKNGGDYLY